MKENAVRRLPVNSTSESSAASSGMADCGT